MKIKGRQSKKNQRQMDNQQIPNSESAKTFRNFYCVCWLWYPHICHLSTSTEQGHLHEF